jgi:hypothetical protein
MMRDKRVSKRFDNQEVDGVGICERSSTGESAELDSYKFRRMITRVCKVEHTTLSVGAGRTYPEVNNTQEYHAALSISAREL